MWDENVWLDGMCGKREGDGLVDEEVELVGG